MIEMTMTLLVHFLQYRLHLSEIVDTDTKNNDRYQSDYWYITSCNVINAQSSIRKFGNYF